MAARPSPIVTEDLPTKAHQTDDLSTIVTSLQIPGVNARDQLVNLIIDGQVPFPFTVTFSWPAETLMANYRQYRPTYRNNTYQIASYTAKNNLYLPSLFRGSPLVITSVGQHHRIDTLTDLFTEDLRIQAKKIYQAQSTAECWIDRACVMRIVDDFFKRQPLNNYNLREALYDKSSEPSLFKLTWLKGLLETILGPDRVQGCRLLDISSGWGDRLLAAMGSGCDYLGFDPNSALSAGHDNMIRAFGDPTRHRVIYLPFEEGNLTTEAPFDLCLTSPPFFNIEIFTGGAQSTDKFPDFLDWMVGFLFASLVKAWTALKPNGYLAIHMGDPKGETISEPMNLFIEQFLPNSSWEGIIGVEGGRGRIAPVWVWQKTTGVPQKWRSKTGGVKNRAFQALYPVLFDRYLSGSSLSLLAAANSTLLSKIGQDIDSTLQKARAKMSPDEVQLSTRIFNRPLLLLPAILTMESLVIENWIISQVKAISAGQAN